MTSWEDVASKGLDFLQKPSGLGAFLVILVLLFSIYAFPLVIVTYYGNQNTDRLERAITNLGTNCLKNVAYQKKEILNAYR